MCECGLFPLYTEQRQSSSCTTTVPVLRPSDLPAPFQRLCLGCIYSIWCGYTNAGDHDPPYWHTAEWTKSPAPELARLFCSPSMADTGKAHFKDYYSKKDMENAFANTSGINYWAAVDWIVEAWKQHQKQKQQQKSSKEEKEEVEGMEVQPLSGGLVGEAAQVAAGAL
jgi:hypothetical protein